MGLLDKVLKVDRAASADAQALAFRGSVGGDGGDDDEAAQGVFGGYLDADEHFHPATEADPPPVKTMGPRVYVQSEDLATSTSPAYSTGDQMSAAMTVWSTPLDAPQPRWKVLSVAVQFTINPGLGADDLEVVFVNSDTTAFTSDDNEALLSDTIVAAVVPLVKAEGNTVDRPRYVAKTDGHEGCDVPLIFGGGDGTWTGPLYVAAAIRYKGAGVTLSSALPGTWYVALQEMP